MTPVAADPRGDNPAPIVVLATFGQQVLVLGMVAFAVGAEVVVSAPTETVSPAAVAALFDGVIICVTAYWYFLVRSTGRRMWVSLAVCDAVLVGAAVVSAFVGLPGIAVMGLLVVVTVCTAWGFNREARRPAR